MGVLEKNTIDFCSKPSRSDPQRIKISERLSEHDLLREIAAMLLIAQQRAHENQGPPTQTEEAWYSTKPRWGGGPGSKLPGLQQAEDEYNGIIHRMNADLDSPDMGLMEVELQGAAKKVKKARVISQNWSTLKGRISSLWHDKTNYMSIGKLPGSTYDEVSKPNTIIGGFTDVK
jgi:hypothetical protein